jgi:transcriptional regulator with XRE-family HTH domain
MNALRSIREIKAVEDSRFTLNRFANSLGISPAHLSRIERGIKQPTPQLLAAAECLLGSDNDELMLAFEQLPPDIKEIMTTHKYRRLYYNLTRRLLGENANTFRLLADVLDGNDLK